MHHRRHSMRRRPKPPFERFKDHFRKFIAFMFSNVGIIILVVFYTIGGAFIFPAIEIAEAQRERLARPPPPVAAVDKRDMNVIARDLWNISCCEANVFNETAFKKRVNEVILQYQAALIEAQLVGLDVEKQWSFSGAFLYSLTVITTIGYGNISPKSSWGKVVTILYSIIGMPLFLLYLSNIGDILAKSFKWIYAKFCLCRVCPGVTRRRILRDRRKARQIARDVLSYMENGSSMSSSSSGSSCTSTSSSSGSSSSRSEMPFSEDDSDIEAEIRADTATVTVPLTVCVGIMIGYILFGATLFGRWEKWDLLNGSYFCFISLSSIGFGDIVPGEQVITADKDKVEVSFILCAVYLLLGMALIAMCFNLMQEQVIHKMSKIKRLIKNCCRCNR